MWVFVITCAVGIQCGIPTELRGQGRHLFETECRLAAEATIDAGGYDKARFVVRCERAR